MSKIMTRLCDKMEDELDQICKKDQLTQNDVDLIYKMIDIVKDISIVEAMKREEEKGWERDYSREYSRGWDEDYSNTHPMYRETGYSYRRGRDSMGRYTSRDDGHEHDEMIANLKSMMNNARTEQERENYRKTIEDLSR